MVPPRAAGAGGLLLLLLPSTALAHNKDRVGDYGGSASQFAARLRTSEAPELLQLVARLRPVPCPAPAASRATSRHLPVRLCCSRPAGGQATVPTNLVNARHHAETHGKSQAGWEVGT